MAAGSIESVTFNGRYFAVTGDSDPGVALGGKKNSVEMNGDKTFRNIQEIAASKVGGVGCVIDHDKDDQKFLQDLADAGENIDFSITYNDGNTFSGSVTITEDLEYSPKSGTMPVTVEGGQLRKQ